MQGVEVQWKAGHGYMQNMLWACLSVCCFLFVFRMAGSEVRKAIGAKVEAVAAQVP